MGKQTENSKNKSSKKNYSFKGHRVIGESKSKYMTESSEGDTTDMMKDILNTDGNTEHNPMMGQQLMNNIMPAVQPNMMNQMNMMHNSMMQPNMMQHMMQPMMQPGMMMNQMPMMGKNNLNMDGDIDPVMVNTLAPINSNQMNGFSEMDFNNLKSSSQMAQGLKSIANLSKLNTGMNINYTPDAQLSDVAPMNQMMQMPQMNQMMQMPQMAPMNQMPPMNQMGPMNINSLKNLVGLNTTPMI